MNLKEKFLYGLVVPSALLGLSPMAAMDHEEIARSVRDLGASQRPAASAVTPTSAAASAAADAAVAAHRRREAEREIEKVARKSPPCHASN